MARKRKIPAKTKKPNTVEEESENGGNNETESAAATSTIVAAEDESTVVAPNATVDMSISQNPMYSIMTNVQQNDLFHNKFIKEMQKLYEKVGCLFVFIYF